MKHVDVVVVGAGQAGISMGYYLLQENLSFVLLDSSERIGDSWRKRYDSLQLFTPRNYSSLPGLEMEGSAEEFPTKDDLADYLEQYVDHFNLPVQLKTTVTKVDKESDNFFITTNQGIIKANQVVIASGAFQKPFIPSVTDGKNDTDVFQLHSSTYVSPDQLPKGSVLVVGGGNSGAQIAVELAKERNVSLATGHPFKFLPLRFLGKSIFKWLDVFGLLHAGINTKRGKWFRKQTDPIFGKELKTLVDTNLISIKPRVVRVNGNQVIFSDGSSVNVDSIIWSTGFSPSYQFINMDGVLSPNGQPIHERGVSPIEGLYFIGLPWQYQRGSALICGVGMDATYLIPHMVEFSNKNVKMSVHVQGNGRLQEMKGERIRL